MMLYLNDKDIAAMGTDWHALRDTARHALMMDAAGDSAHPIKPYLRFQNPQNRIIAMPAYVGGDIGLSGMKWIASFPGNVEKGLPRAHNTVILNHIDTGEPLAFFHSARLSGLRTAAVSSLMVQAYMDARQPVSVCLGILGWGPIGRLHLEMCAAMLGEQLEQVYIYDPRGIDPITTPEVLRSKTVITENWQEVYRLADIMATCTVASSRYIDEKPREGMLLLGVSLRDYLPESVAHLKGIVVDDWDEVCRENTDIEQLHQKYGLHKEAVHTLADVVCGQRLRSMDRLEPIFFNPMGLAIFDIAAAGYYWRKAVEHGIGVKLSV
ncbi:2,3-diaminopropionate biosynthesis protein SbnB [Paenibacillus sp. JSM ZJ436]|uniref:2,3-diaminopropionate biosynthesis protein SbnB n=1 Tax=Paenibacillus sp. JSM ZJ436 TaxID=3376190 RepID=UPI0037950E04